MKRDKLKHITNSYYRLLKKYILLFDENINKEKLHQFRVTYKKLRAFFRMLSMGSRTKKKIRIPGKLKQVYILAGTIRDLQIQQQRIKKINIRYPGSEKGYIAVLQREIDYKKSVFNEMISGKLITVCKQHTDALLPPCFYIKDMNKFLINKWKYIRDTISPGDQTDSTLHSIRNNLKDVYYNLNVFLKETTALTTINNLKENATKHLEEVLQNLGNFQDTCVAIKLLNSARTKNLSPSEQLNLSNIRQQWRKDKSKNKVTLIKQLQTLISVNHSRSV